jgi:hypothetical protein
MRSAEVNSAERADPSSRISDLTPDRAAWIPAEMPPFVPPTTVTSVRMVCAVKPREQRRKNNRAFIFLIIVIITLGLKIRFL